MAATALDFILSQIQLREAPNNLPPNFQENNNRQLFALSALIGPMSSPTTITIEGNERFNGGTCLSIHLFWLEIRMRRIVFSGAFILFCLLGGVGGVICRSCNLSIPFHGCLLDFGTCRTKPGQYCIKEVHIKGGIQWYSVQGCTESQDECFKRIVTTYEIHSTHCCHRPLCNF
ncbi:LOW QUALITY PROTEIN: uncharacterized protein C9orf57 homolog [Monodon monoceros]|nr:LOW QUALITY PROTEIN: uncharacterized protein C9orf57 homolog [Monodon monoceros]